MIEEAIQKLNSIKESQISNLDLSENSKWTIEHKLSFLLRHELPFEEFIAKGDLLLIDIDANCPIYASDKDAKYAKELVNDPEFNLKNRESTMIQTYYKKVVKLKAVCLALAGNFFDHLQLFEDAEMCYLKYAELAENNYGNESQVASNVYYTLGNFYFKRGLVTKPLMCFKHSKQLREKIVGKMHSSVIDCHLGILAVLVTANQIDEALLVFKEAEGLVLKYIGNLNIPLAKLYHLACIIYRKIDNQEKAFFYIMNSRNITKRLSESSSMEKGLHELRKEEEVLMAEFDNENFAEYFNNFKDSFSMFEVMRRTANS